MTRITVTIPTGKNKADFFSIEFKAEDFDAVVEAVASLTHENIYTNPLWKVL